MGVWGRWWEVGGQPLNIKYRWRAAAEGIESKVAYLIITVGIALTFVSYVLQTMFRFWLEGLGRVMIVI